MKKQVRRNEIVGKVIAGVVLACDESGLLVWFTDDTFTAFKAHSCYDSPPAIEEDIDFDVVDFGSHDWLVKGGFISAEEMNHKAEQRRAEFIRGQSERERALYEQLKKRFEGD